MIPITKEAWEYLNTGGFLAIYGSAVRPEDFGLRVVDGVVVQHGSDVPLCAGHAEGWFCQRDSLRGGITASCVVCAYEKETK